jgi:hypothetical protein
MPTGETLAGQVGGLNKSIHAQRSPLLRLRVFDRSTIRRRDNEFHCPDPIRRVLAAFSIAM